MKISFLILFLTIVWMNRPAQGMDISVPVGEIGRFICQLKNTERCKNLLNNSNNTMNQKVVNISFSVDGLDRRKHGTTTPLADADQIVTRDASENSEINSQIVSQNDNLVEDNFTIISATTEMIEEEITKNNNYLSTEYLTESSSSYENISNGNLSTSTSGNADFPYTLVIAISASAPALVMIIIGFVWKTMKCQLKLSLRTNSEKKEDANVPKLPSPFFSINVEPVGDETEDTNGYLVPKLVKDKQALSGTISNDSVSKHIYEEIDE